MLADAEKPLSAVRYRYTFRRRIPISSFAMGFKREHSAVEAALTPLYSSGLTERQINRSKLIKKPMYGRASFDLLRHSASSVQLECC